MKKLIAIILCLVMLFSFAACGETNNSVQHGETTALSAETDCLTATDEDFDYLEAIVCAILRSAPDTSPIFVGYEDDHEFAELVRGISSPDIYENAYIYNSSSDNALAEAMYMIWNQRSCGFYSFLDMDIEEESYCRYDENGDPCEMPADPMNMFADSYGYIKLNADDVDWILKNILCVTPDRTKTDNDFDTSEYHGVFNYYYYDGYYYYEVEEGGGGGHTNEVVDYSVQPDGSYIVKLSSYNEIYAIDDSTGTLDEDYVYTIYEVSTALKEVDGKRTWAVSYLKVSEYVLNVENVSNNLKATEEDFDTLTAVTYGIWYSSSYTWAEDGYIHNKDSDYALVDAMNMIYNDGLSLAFEIDECYGLELEYESFLNDYSGESPVFSADPLFCLPTDSPGACGYIKINADQVDWILENILCVTPDRARVYFDLNPSDDDSSPDCYYHEGYYYYLIQEGGGGGDHPTVIDYVQQPDGSYTVKFSACDEEYNPENDHRIFEVSATLKEVDGKRVWAVSSVEVTAGSDF